jgi:hypothetical protein
LPAAVMVLASSSRNTEFVPIAKMLASSCVTSTTVAPRLSRSSRIRSSRPPGADRIEAGRWLVEKQDVRVQRHRARQAGPLAHAAAELRRIEVLEAREAHQRELERRDVADRGRGQLGELLDRQPDVLGERHRAPQRAFLVQDPDPAQDPLPTLRVRRPEARVVVVDVAPRRRHEPDHVPEQRALAGPARPHDHEDVAGRHGEAEVPLDHPIAVPHVEVADLDARPAPGCDVRGGPHVGLKDGAGRRGPSAPHPRR